MVENATGGAILSLIRINAVLVAFRFEVSVKPRSVWILVSDEELSDDDN